MERRTPVCREKETRKRENENHDVYLSLPSPLARLRFAVSPLPLILDFPLDRDTHPCRTLRSNIVRSYWNLRLSAALTLAVFVQVTTMVGLAVKASWPTLTRSMLEDSVEPFSARSMMQERRKPMSECHSSTMVCGREIGKRRHLLVGATDR
jgi:hypothetical protein